MSQKELRYDDLSISLDDVYEAMEYQADQPDMAVAAETRAVMSEVSSWLRPRFCFFVAYGELGSNFQTLTLEETTLKVGKIIGRQLKGSEAFACFVATAGMEFEAYQQRLMREGDMVKVFIANALGSVIAEKCADEMEVFLQQSIEKLGWKHTNRFSPGYCGWHVSEQQRLFPLFHTANPCGVQLTDSSLMVPIKSVSGIIGVGKEVRKLDYTCGLCDFEKCYKKKMPKKAPHPPRGRMLGES